MKAKDPQARATDDHCLTEAGLTGNESTCKDVAVEYCDGFSLTKPSNPLRQCRSDCINTCMLGENCTWNGGIRFI